MSRRDRPWSASALRATWYTQGPNRSESRSFPTPAWIAGRCPAGHHRRRWRPRGGEPRTGGAAPRAPARRPARSVESRRAFLSSRSRSARSTTAPSGLTAADRRRGDVVLRARARHPVTDELAAPRLHLDLTSAKPTSARMPRSSSTGDAPEMQPVSAATCACSASGRGEVATTSESRDAPQASARARPPGRRLSCRAPS